MKGVNTAKNFLIIPNNLLQIFFKMSQKTNSKSSRSKWCLIDNKIAHKITKISKTLQKKKKNQKQLQMNIIKKYLKKDISLQKNDRKLLMIWDKYNNTIMEYQKIINF